MYTKTPRPVYVAIFSPEGSLIKEYWIDHNDRQQRKVLGEQVSYAFAAGQMVITAGVPQFKQRPSFSFCILPTRKH